MKEIERAKGVRGKRSTGGTKRHVREEIEKLKVDGSEKDKTKRGS